MLCSLVTGARRGVGAMSMELRTSDFHVPPAAAERRVTTMQDVLSAFTDVIASQRDTGGYKKNHAPF